MKILRILYITLFIILIISHVYAQTNWCGHVDTVFGFLFNEANGTNLADNCEGTAGYDGSLIGGTVDGSTGKYNNGYLFDGVDDNVNISNAAFLDNLTTLSVCAWVYHDTLTTDDNIIDNFNGGTAGFVLWRDDSGLGGRTDTYSVEIGGASWILTGATNASIATTWTHVCFTYTGGSATGLRLYVNGTEDANSPFDVSGLANSGDTAYTLDIGETNTIGDEFDGNIDEVIVSTKSPVWSAADIQSLMTNGIDASQAASGAGTKINGGKFNNLKIN